MIEITDREIDAYGFLRLYSIDLEMARQSCDLLTTIAELQAQHAILRDAVISYCRPFSGNRAKDGSTHHLSLRFVPRDLRELHDELFDLRMQAFAHTDVEFRRPQIGRWPRAAGGANYVMGFRNPSYDDLLRRLPELRELVCQVENAVNTKVRECETRFERLYAAHPREGADAPGA